MNPNLKVYAAVRVNGIVTDWGFTELKHVPIKLGRFIMESELDSREFSTLELRLSKRQINWDSRRNEEEVFMQGLPVAQVDPDDFIDDKEDITYGEFAALSDDPVWTQYIQLQSNPSRFNTEEQRDIRQTWNRKYGETKFVRLVIRGK